jgi:aspartate-semialdehyde dehydrogenase
MPGSREKPTRVAIVGASCLRGKELKLVLEDRKFPAGEIILFDEPVLAGTLTEAAGEPTFIRALDEDSFERADFAFFAGSAQDAERNWHAAQSSGARVIDMTGAIGASGNAITWIPTLESVLPRRAATGLEAGKPAPYSSPAPGAIITCAFAAGLQRFSPARLVAMLFPPVSERDQAGVDELESQTTNLLSFKPIEQSVFDAQVAFNLLAGYGEECKPALKDLRAAISRDAASYLAGRAPVPAIQLVQAPVFYGYAFAAYAEFGSPQVTEQLESAFRNLGIKVATAGDPAPNNVSVAGEGEIQIARIEADPAIANGVWIWGAVDNLRLAATNAVQIAEELIEAPAAYN